MLINNGIKVSHVTIASLFQSIAAKLSDFINLNSDEWHADETVVKINGKKYYVWFIIDFETRFVISFHLSPYKSSPQAFSLLIVLESMELLQVLLLIDTGLITWLQKLPFQIINI